MGKATARDWTRIYSMEDCQSLIFLLIHAILFSSLSVFFLLYFDLISASFESLALPGSVTALSAVCLFFAAGNIFYSSVALQWEIAQLMLSLDNDWSTVKHALDVGCGRGILLNAVAMQLKKEGSSGRVVGLDRRKTTLSTLLTAKLEGSGRHVVTPERWRLGTIISTWWYPVCSCTRWGRSSGSGRRRPWRSG